MTNKEKYKQAFSVLHPSGELSLEVKHMILNSKKARFKTAIAAAAVCMLLAGGSGVAYAANIGGIQRTIQLWIYGDQTNVDFKYSTDGTYNISYQNDDGALIERGGGGVAFDDDGNERPLTEEELLEELNSPEVKYEEDGTVWVYYKEQKMEITDRFQDDVCYVKLSDGEETLYMTIKYQNGCCISPDKYASPDSFN
ncbi:MAG: DUF4179 domain-containing protein [Roseburia sp.]|nr:DUF4179 domain-containing protein [Roseburia sp.]MCM1279817.1 DUF4179 domain-containing protein [Robinsoniella sp.]